jgi:hypothetical protein
MQKIMIALITVLCSVAPVISNAAEVSGIEILDYGSYRFEVDTAKSTAKNVILVEQTNRVSATLGANFGFRFRINGYPKGEKIVLTKKIIHPALTNPKTNKTTTSEKTIFEAVIGSKNITGMDLVKEWELVPGEWTLQVIYKGNKVAEKSFTVFKKE